MEHELPYILLPATRAQARHPSRRNSNAPGGIFAQGGTPGIDEEMDNMSRPYRLWDNKTKHDVRWCYYASPARALEAALRQVHWAKPGATIDVYNCETGNVFGQYTRRPVGITFWRKP